MFCKSLRAAAKNDAPCRFLNALVQIPVVKCRKTKNGQVNHLSVLIGGEEDVSRCFATNISLLRRSPATKCNLTCFAYLLFPFSRELVPAQLRGKEKSNPTGCVGLHFGGGEEEIRPTAKWACLHAKRSVQRRVRQQCCRRHKCRRISLDKTKSTLPSAIFVAEKKRFELLNRF